ncbi:MAG: hypothetical protein HY880_06220 [Deltaproteobacteria bacterium]|nr:hypothetical protein [Deltaproteobacteria bacterium]
MKAFNYRSFSKPVLLALAVVLAGIVIGYYPGEAAEPPKKTDAKKPTTTSPLQTDADYNEKITTKIDPNDPNSVLYLDTSGKPAGVGDPKKPASEAVKIGKGWHPQALAASGLPLDRYGLIDWAKAVRDNKIRPRHSLDPKEDEMPPLPMDVIIPTKSDYVDDVTYPHEIHTWWLKCEVCHPKIFLPAKGENKMTMADIARGEFCGRCHGKVSFPLTDCTRCHNSLKKAVVKGK